ncbi:MAG: hypothetical protein HY548_02215 [Elusimicrobia bacterium]|nr:hypothetical protein [Elusimicrobiota bacterium]
MMPGTEKKAGNENRSPIPRDNHERFIARLEADRYYGVVETHFEAGRIVRTKTHTTLLLDDVNRVLGQ